MPLRSCHAGLGLAFALAACLLCSELPFSGICRVAEAPRTADEYAVKAAFLYQLAKFVDWPANKLKADDSPLIIGVTGQEAFERVSATLQGKSMDRHKVIVRLITGEDQIHDCHILLVSRSQKQRVPEMLDTASKAAVLTLGEADDFLESGGMIRFYIESDNLRLEIDMNAVRRAGVSIKANALSTLISKGIGKLRKD